MTGESRTPGFTATPDELFEALYLELRRLAASKISREDTGQTLQATALVHEAWLRLGADQQPAWENRAHFMSAAAEAMRRILVENARRKLRAKRGGGAQKTKLQEANIPAPAEDEKILLVHQTLNAFAKENPELAEIVKLRFFVGLNNQEIAAMLNVNEKTVRRHWEIAKVRLYQKMKLTE